MRILILGGDGMLGHQLLQSWQARHEVKVTLRGVASVYQPYGLFDLNNSFYGVDVGNFSSVKSVLRQFQPEAVINAVGIVKQRAQAKDAILSIEINALFPHRLSLLCAEQQVRLVHVSTDCVFSGQKGMYTEYDVEDAKDLYGRSKLLGEVHDAHALTLRTSIIGLELSRNASLIEWFLAQKGHLKGFKKAIYSGFTTLEMANVMEHILLHYPHVSGLWHVASQPIDKYTLLSKLAGLLARQDMTLVADTTFVCDRSLDASRFIQEMAYQPPSWDKMLQALVQQIQVRSA